MKVLFAGEVVEEHESSKKVLLKTGFGDPVLMVANDKVIPQVIGCAFCGFPTPMTEPGTPNQPMIDHILSCEKHPMGKMAAAILCAGMALEAADEDIAGSLKDPDGPHVPSLRLKETREKIDLALKACGRRPR